MRNVVMIRREAGLVSIPVENAVYCRNCKTISTSRQWRCGLCGSERLVSFSGDITGPPEPTPTPAIARVA